MPLAIKREEELQERYLPQLAARFQRGPNDVLHTDSERYIKQDIKAK